MLDTFPKGAYIFKFWHLRMAEFMEQEECNIKLKMQ